MLNNGDSDVTRGESNDTVMGVRESRVKMSAKDGSEERGNDGTRRRRCGGDVPTETGEKVADAR